MLFAPFEAWCDQAVFFQHLQVCEYLGYRKKDFQIQAFPAALRKKGYQRIRIDGEVYNLSESLSLLKNNRHTIEIVVDRLSLTKKQFDQTIAIHPTGAEEFVTMR